MPWRNLGNRTNVQLKFLDKLNWASNGSDLAVFDRHGLIG